MNIIDHNPNRLDPKAFIEMHKDKKQVNLMYLIIESLHESIALLGGESDLLSITGSIGDTLTPLDALYQISVWNSAKKDELNSEEC